MLALKIVALAGMLSIAAATAHVSAASTGEDGASDRDSSAPSITDQPGNEIVDPGETATFLVVARGTAPLTYQWMLNGAPIPGATATTYTTPAALSADNGARYSVRITNVAGTVVSNSVTLNVRRGGSRSGDSGRNGSPTNPRMPGSWFLLNSYAGLQLGYTGHAISNAQLQPGFKAESVQVPHLSARFILYGHEFGKYFSGQISEIVGVHSAVYRNINGNPGNYPLWMNNIGGVTGKARLPISARVSLYGEGGLGFISRNGIEINQAEVLKSANYVTFLYGGGVDYRLNQNWDLLTGVIVAPGNAGDHQPAAEFFSGGFNYTVRRIPADMEASTGPDGSEWPKNMVRIGFITDALGFGANDFFSTGKFRVFWHGSVDIANGASLDYQRNLFHTQRFFALDWGADIASWKSRKDAERFYSASIYPVLRFPLVQTNPAEFYISYSLAGPSVLSRITIDGLKTGRSFTFQDYMGTGIYLGRRRRITCEVRITHYSNGNLFAQNPGLTVPLGFYLGTAF